MIDIRDLFLSQSTPDTVNQQMRGWITVIDEHLFLLDLRDGDLLNAMVTRQIEDSERQDAKNRTPKVRIANDDLIYPIRAAVLPRGGGEGFLFHRVHVGGRLTKDFESSSFSIDPVALSIEDSPPRRWIEIDTKSANIETLKSKYGNLLKLKSPPNGSKDWILDI